MSRHDDVFEVVFVCTGNRARSPLAEALYRRYSVGVKTDVSSAGTLGLEAMPPLPLAIEAGRRLGVDVSQHRARGFRTTPLSTADLVLGFEPIHISAAITGGARADRTFLLAELVLLLDGSWSEPDPVARGRSAIARADQRRVRSFPHAPEVFIADPLGKPVKEMYRTASEIDRLVRRLVLGLFGELAPPLPSRRGS